VVFDIHGLGEQLKPAGLLVITDTMLNRVAQNWKKGKRTHVIIDEFHVVFENEFSAAFFFFFCRQFRKRNAYAYDTPEEFTDAEKYLQTIRDELPYMATTGMRFETLTKDPEVRKAVDDIVYDFNGEKNPHPLAYYQADGQKTPVKEGKAKER